MGERDERPTQVSAPPPAENVTSITRSPSRVAAWWRRGATPTPWVHAVLAAAVGVVAADTSWRFVVIVLVGGLWGLLALLIAAALTGAALVGLAWFVTRRRSAWAQLVPGGAVVVAAAASFALAPPVGPDGVSLDLSAAGWRVWLVGGVLAAVAALAAHAGPPRLVALLVAVTAAAVGVTSVVTTLDPPRSPADEAAATARAQDAMGADYRPVTIDVGDYGSIWEATAVPGVGFVQPFSSPKDVGHGLGQQDGTDLTVSTLPAAVEPCGRTLEGVGESGGAEDETSCETRGDLVYRTSASGHEVGGLVGDVFVAVSARDEVDEEALVTAVRSATPIDDAAYRHLLFGDGDEYTDEMDGQRCPLESTCG